MTSSIPPQTPRRSGPERVASPLVAELAAAASAGHQEAVPRFWRGVEQSGTPLLERLTDGRSVVTFVWRAGDEIDEVLVVANKIADAHTYDRHCMERLVGTDVWSLSLVMGERWRASYAVAPKLHEDRDEHRSRVIDRAQLDLIDRRRRRAKSIADANDHAALDRWFDALGRLRPDPLAREQLDQHWSVVSMPDAPTQPWHAPRPDVERGSLRPTCSPVGRQIWWYEPPGRPRASLPLVVLLDGDVWVPDDVSAMFDNLIADREVPPFAALLVASGDQPERVRDLTCSVEFVADLVEAIDALAGAGIALGEADRTVVAGQSLGGLTAVFAAMHRPDRFGHAVSQSGSFWWPTDHDGVALEQLTTELEQRRPTRRALTGTVYLEVGTHEWVLVAPTRRLGAALEHHGVDVRYHEFVGGHDRACWRGGLADGLIAVMSAWRTKSPVR